MTNELFKDQWGVEGPRLTTIPGEDEDSDEEKSVDSAQKELDNIFMESHEFTHPVATYQLLESQSNQEAEQTLGLVHSEQSFRNAKAVVTSTSTSAAVDSDFEGNDFTDKEFEEIEEEVDWVNNGYFPVEHVFEEYKSQARRAIKESMVEDPTHKKLSSSYMDNLKLHKMQFISLHTNLKSVHEEIENAKEKQKSLFHDRLPAMTMLNMENKLKEESKMVERIERIEESVGTMEGTLKTILDENIHTNQLLQKLLESQLKPEIITKKGRHMSLHISLNQVKIQLKKLLVMPLKERG